MKVLMRWWSGTGNTRRAANLTAEAFRRAGWEVDAAELRADSPPPTADQVAAADRLWIAAPALGFSAPEHFLRALGRWPDCAGRPLAVLAVGGAEVGRKGLVSGWTGSLAADAARPLVRRGAVWTSWAEVSYPVSWTQVLPPASDAACGRIREAADAAVGAYAARLIAGTAPPPRMGAGRRAAGLFNALLFRPVARRFLGRLYAADPACNGCGVCARSCPAGAVTLKALRPSWSLDCDGCNRCLNVCPQAAVQVPWFRLAFLGGGHLALFAVCLAWAVNGRPLEALAVYLGGTVVQFTAGEGLLSSLESHPRWGAALTRGWTSGWGRYRG